MSLTLRVDVGDTLGFFDALSKEAPKAISIAINRTAEDGLAVIRQNVKKGFTIRTLPLNFVAPQKLPKEFRADDRKGKLWALLEPEGAGKILNPFEDGEPNTGTKLAGGSSLLTRKVAVPSTRGQGALRPTKGTVIARKLYPINLGLQIVRDAKANVLYYNRGRGSKKRGITGAPPVKGKFGTYTVPRRDGRGIVILQRNKGAKVSSLWWSLLDRVPRPPNLKFYAGVQEAVDTRWGENMSGAWDAAVRHSESGRARGLGA